MTNKIIAVDFDGTLCENAWPDIGKPIRYVIDYVLDQQKAGAKLILWTNRHDEELNAAIEWCKANGITFDAVNENLPAIIEAFGGDTRKVFANEYLDDRAKSPEDILICKTISDIASAGDFTSMAKQLIASMNFGS